MISQLTKEEIRILFLPMRWRSWIKRAMKEFIPGSRTYKFLDYTQYHIKIIINNYYGEELRLLRG